MSSPSQPAFPGIEGPGMTLRQWFAGQALAGMGTWMPNGPQSSLNDSRSFEARAKWAFAQADAMIVEGGE